MELSGEVSVSGIANADTLLERAFLFMEDRDFSSADRHLEKVLDADPKCAKAYIGKLMCQQQVAKMDALAEGVAPLSGNSFYEKAIRFAPDAERKQYEAYNQAVLTRNATVREAKLAQLEAEREQVAQMERDLQSNKGLIIRDIAVRILRKLLLVLSILCSVFWVICGFALVQLFFVGIPFFVWTFFMIRWNIRARKSVSKYEQAKLELKNAKTALVGKEAEYNLWVQMNCN